MGTKSSKARLGAPLTLVVAWGMVGCGFLNTQIPNLNLPEPQWGGGTQAAYESPPASQRARLYSDEDVIFLDRSEPEGWSITSDNMGHVGPLAQGPAPELPPVRESFIDEPFYPQTPPAHRTTGPTELDFDRNAPSTGASRFSPDTYRGHPRAVPFSATIGLAPEEQQIERHERAGAREIPRAIEVPEPRAIPPVESGASVLGTPTVQAPAKAPIRQETRPQALLVPEEDEVIYIGDVEVPTTESAQEMVAALPPAKVPAEVPTAVSEITREPTQAPAATEFPPARVSRDQTSFSDDPNCKKAAEEAERARNSASDADKLFYFRRAMRLCPEHPIYHIEVGAIYAGIGRIEDAAYEFKRAIELDPNNEAAKESLRILEGQKEG